MNTIWLRAKWISGHTIVPEWPVRGGDEQRVVCAEQAEAALRSQADEIAKLRAKLATCKKDAERYRWLRKAREGVYVLILARWIDMHGRDLDAAIDAARKGEEE